MKAYSILGEIIGESVDEDLVATITKKVLEQLGK